MLIGLNDEDKWRLLYFNPDLLMLSLNDRIKPFISEIEKFLINYYEEMKHEKPFEDSYNATNNLLFSTKMFLTLPMLISDFIKNMRIAKDYHVVDVCLKNCRFFSYPPKYMLACMLQYRESFHKGENKYNLLQHLFAKDSKDESKMNDIIKEYESRNPKELEEYFGEK